MPPSKNLEERVDEAEFMERIAAGETLTSIARSYDVGINTVRRWIHGGSATYPKDGQLSGREAAFREAQHIAAETLIEEGMELLDNAKVATAAEATVLIERAKHRRWRAATLDPQYRDKGASVNVNIQAVNPASLESLLQHPDRPALPALPAIEEADYEVIEDANSPD